MNPRILAPTNLILILSAVLSWRKSAVRMEKIILQAWNYIFIVKTSLFIFPDKPKH